MTPPRILFVSPRLPFPPNSGTKIRIANLLQALTDVGDVDLVAYGFEREIAQVLADPASSVPDWDGLRSATLLQHPTWSVAEAPVLPFRLARSLFRRDPVLYSTFPSGPLMRQLQPLAERADLIWVERLYAALPLRQHAHKIVVDLDDLESVKVSREAQHAPSAFGRWALEREAARLEASERAAARTFRKVAVCSPEDARFFGADSAKAWVIPNGVGDALMERAALLRDPFSLVFIGTMNYMPNIDAVLYFCREVLPLIRAQAPSTTLTIVGLNPADPVRALADGQSVFVHANVPDVAPYVQCAAVSVVPLRVGGGTRLKILESMALGTPVVSTTVGAEGLHLSHGKELMLADTAADFADAVLRCLKDEILRNQLSTSGHQRVDMDYRWSSIRATTATRCQALIQELRQQECPA